MPIQDRAPERNPGLSRTQERIGRPPLVHITQLTPAFAGFFPGKIIHRDGRIEAYPNIQQWRWRQVTIRTPGDLFTLLRNAECSILIRGSPQPSTGEITYKRKAKDSYPTGFTDR